MGTRDGPDAVHPVDLDAMGETRTEPTHRATPSAENAWDSIYSAAAYLCGGRPAIGSLDQAILSYDHSDAYVRWVLAKAADYGLGADTTAVGTVVGG